MCIILVFISIRVQAIFNEKCELQNNMSLTITSRASKRHRPLPRDGPLRPAQSPQHRDRDDFECHSWGEQKPSWHQQ